MLSVIFFIGVQQNESLKHHVHCPKGFSIQQLKYLLKMQQIKNSMDSCNISHDSLNKDGSGQFERRHKKYNLSENGKILQFGTLCINFTQILFLMAKRIRKPVSAADSEVLNATKKTRGATSRSAPKATAPKKKIPTPKKAPAKVPKTKKVAKPKAVKKAPQGPQGYTPDEYQKFKEQKERLSSFGNAALKQMLKKNLQSMSGNKEDLILKVADGIVLGRIPRCPNCFGGRPKYDYKTGQYACPGYRDDEDYHNCHSTFTKDELKRDPWQ